MGAGYFAPRESHYRNALAVAAAEAWEMVEVGTRDESRAKKLARLFGVNNAYVSQARLLVEYAPEVAAAVKSGAGCGGHVGGTARGLGSSQPRRR